MNCVKALACKHVSYSSRNNVSPVNASPGMAENVLKARYPTRKQL